MGIKRRTKFETTFEDLMAVFTDGPEVLVLQKVTVQGDTPYYQTGWRTHPHTLDLKLPQFFHTKTAAVVEGMIKRADEFRELVPA